jgi:hypothetical protein
MNLDKFIRQPSNIHALGVIAAGAGAALAHVATGNPKIDIAIAALAYVLTHLGINDNSVLEASTTALVTDLTSGAPTVKTMTDAAGVVGALQPAAQVVTTATTAPSA